MSVLDTITVDLAVVLGSAELPIRQILRMSRGAMIPLDAKEDDPTLILVNDKLVAYGQVIVDRDQILVEITEVVSRNMI